VSFAFRHAKVTAGAPSTSTILMFLAGGFSAVFRTLSAVLAEAQEDRTRMFALSTGVC